MIGRATFRGIILRSLSPGLIPVHFLSPSEFLVATMNGQLWIVPSMHGDPHPTDLA